MASPFHPHARGVTVEIRLTPKARREGVEGTMPGENETTLLKVSVNAPPEDGKANKALLALLAKAWKMPKSALSLLSGETSRHKVVLAEGAEIAKLEAWLREIA